MQNLAFGRDGVWPCAVCSVGVRGAAYWNCVCTESRISACHLLRWLFLYLNYRLSGCVIISAAIPMIYEKTK